MTTATDTGIKPQLLLPRLRKLEAGDGRRASYLELSQRALRAAA